jgi:hypothetical protein
MLQQSGENAMNIKHLIISDLIKSPNFAIFSSGGRLFHFKGSICVKKRARSHHLCPKAPIMDRNLEQFIVLNDGLCSFCRLSPLAHS